MKLRYWCSGAAVLMVALLVVASCSKKSSDVVARVGDYDITVKEFNDLGQNFVQPYATAQAEFDAKKTFLDSAIIQRLLIQGGYEKGLDKTEEMARSVLANKDKFMLDILYQKQIESKVSATDAEIRDFYNHLEFKKRVSHILVASKDTADALLKQLAAGENFEKLAFEHSIDPGAKRNQGDLGYMAWGAMPNLPGFDDAIYKLEVGEVSPPIKTRFGWHLIKVADKQPNEMRRDFTASQKSVEQQVLNGKRTRLTSEYIESLKAKYPVTVDSTVCDYLIKKRAQLYPPELLKGLPKNDFDDSQLDRNEKEMVLATWEGGQVSLAEYLTDARRLPAQVRPSFERPDSLATTIFQLKITDILVFEANKAGYENDPEFKRKLQLFKDLSVAEAMRGDSVMMAPTPNETEIRAYYDQHPKEFTDPARVRVYEILLSDELQATKLARAIKSMQAFRDKAAVLTERPGKRESGGDLGYIQKEWYPDLFDVAWNTAVGGIGGPVVTAGGKYSIFYVVDKIDESVKDFLGVKDQIIANLRTKDSEQRFNDWVKEHRDKTKIEINEDAIWGTINKERYAAANTAPTQKGN